MSRLFTPQNARLAAVHDVETKEQLHFVMSVDIDAGVVVQQRRPLRLVGDEVDSTVVRYRYIHPIYAGRHSPVLFHCYGRIS